MEEYNPLSVLVVEDDDAAREILASVLAITFPQNTFYVADNGKTGLESFIKYRPAVVVTDVNMPMMDGIRMAEGIKAIAAGVKLIVLTAFSDKTVLDSSEAAGIKFDHYILKPIDYGKLFAAIKQCLAGVEPTPTLTTQGSDDDQA